MFGKIFAELTGARMARLPYFAYTLLLTVTLVVVVFAIVTGIAGFENLRDGNITAIEKRFAEDAGGTLLIAFILFLLTLMFAHFNLMAKRLRDIGFPGWPGVLAVFVGTAVVTAVIGDNYAGTINTLVWLVLVLIPGNLVGNRGRAAPAGD